MPVAKGRLTWSWHPLARIGIGRAETGRIASARIRAMQEFAGELLVFLDDDNVLEPDYLRKCSDLLCGPARPGRGQRLPDAGV